MKKSTYNDIQSLQSTQFENVNDFDGSHYTSFDKPKLNLTVEEFVKLNTYEQELEKTSLFDRISIYLWVEKPFAWGELKGL